MCSSSQKAVVNVGQVKGKISIFLLYVMNTFLIKKFTIFIGAAFKRRQTWRRLPNIQFVHSYNYEKSKSSRQIGLCHAIRRYSTKAVLILFISYL